MEIQTVQIPLLGNSAAVGIASLLHIAIASLAVAFMLLAPVAEAIGRFCPHFEELARSMTRFTLVTYTAGLVLAVLMVELFIGFYPITNAWLFNRFRMPIGIALAAFLLQLLLLYPYYHFWDRIRTWSIRVHVGMGMAAFALMLVWVGVLDAIGSFMLTPRMDEGGTRLMNPSCVTLIIHRLFGDLVVAGYAMAGYGAWRLSCASDTDRFYYAFMARTGMCVGLFALLVQPVTGFAYGYVIEHAAPDAYREMLSGRYQPLLYGQTACVALLFAGSALWIRLTHGLPAAGILHWAFLAVAVLTVGFADAPGWRRAWTALLVLGTLWQLLKEGTPLSAGMDTIGEKEARWTAAALALLALGTYLTMGIMRESLRHPYTVHHVIVLTDGTETVAGAGEHATGGGQ
ncbi:hypothetical protein W02_31060 [Nitrospira sp. KM1]|uniref:hypothetical protein n=1 Tax=Nitrospira sp. KM1 TaxID=1936990 RepID=UPI0013A737AF|nr:hypothetical protein [Nitrospira sp. KM1]BCA55966.1 hypothetical protein W02_31060 [Nitrospira sp. KM1]